MYLIETTTEHENEWHEYETKKMTLIYRAFKNFVILRNQDSIETT
jgi:hypothetical protein